ncbi:hypothetical protein ACVJMZ_006455 [Sinorhizobium medicae]
MELESCQCSVVALHNDHRPRSGLGWLTPPKLAQTANPRRVAVLRSRNGCALQPAAAAAEVFSRQALERFPFDALDKLLDRGDAVAAGHVFDVEVIH